MAVPAALTASVRTETCARVRVRPWPGPPPSPREGQAALGSARAGPAIPPSLPSAAAAEDSCKKAAVWSAARSAGRRCARAGARGAGTRRRNRRPRRPGRAGSPRVARPVLRRGSCRFGSLLGGRASPAKTPRAGPPGRGVMVPGAGPPGQPPLRRLLRAGGGDVTGWFWVKTVFREGGAVPAPWALRQGSRWSSRRWQTGSPWTLAMTRQ